MSPLFLSGGGDEQQTRYLDQTFVEHIAKQKSLLYIPIAMDEGSKSYESCFNWISATLTPLGINDIKMWTDLHNKTLEDVLDFSAIYIGGGNTFNLLHDLYQASFIDVLVKYLKQGGIVYGGSAGAIIFGRDIATSSYMDTNEKNLKRTEGLNRVHGYSIWCHYNPEHDNLILKYIQEHEEAILALPEETGLMVTKQKICVIGDGVAYRFTKKGKERIEAGCMILGGDIHGE